MTRGEGERLAVLEQAYAQIDIRLFGNGQPGELARMSLHMEALGKRIGGIEKSYWRVVGGLGVLVMLANITGALVVPLLLKAWGGK